MVFAATSVAALPPAPAAWSAGFLSSLSIPQRGLRREFLTRRRILFQDRIEYDFLRQKVLTFNLAGEFSSRIEMNMMFSSRIELNMILFLNKKC